MSFVKYLISKQFIIQIVIAVVVLTIGFFGLVRWLNVTTNHGEKIEVPDLSKLSIDEVGLRLKELNLRYEVIDSSSYNPNYPKKSVITQSPEKESFVKEDRKIYLTLNPSKYGQVTIHEFYGKTKNEVFAQLRSSGFKIGEIIYIPDIGRNVVRGLRIGEVEVLVGDRLDKHSVVDVVLGDGKER